MKFLILGIIIGGLVYSPIYLMETQVEPQLEVLKNQYANAEQIANRAIAQE